MVSIPLKFSVLAFGLDFYCGSYFGFACVRVLVYVCSAQSGFASVFQVFTQRHWIELSCVICFARACPLRVSPVSMSNSTQPMEGSPLSVRKCRVVTGLFVAFSFLLFDSHASFTCFVGVFLRASIPFCVLGFRTRDFNLFPRTRVWINPPVQFSICLNDSSIRVHWFFRIRTCVEQRSGSCNCSCGRCSHL